MRVGSLLMVAWQGVQRRPLRNILTAMSLLVGVVTMVVIQAGETQLQRAIVLDSVLQYGPATTMEMSIISNDPSSTAEEWRQLLSRMTADAGGHSSVVVQGGGARLSVGGRPAPNLSILLVDPGIRQIRPFPLLLGRWFGGRPGVAPDVVVNLTAWQQLSMRGQVTELGSGIALGRRHARVLGVVYDGVPSPNAYMRLDDPATWQDVVRPDDPVSVLVQSPRLDEATLLRRIHAIAQVSGRSAEVGEIRRSDLLDDYAEQVRSTGRVFAGIGVLSLLVGSMGILNIGLATVRYRADELSLRRAFGATRVDVAAIMILESLIVALAAAAAAILLSNLALPLVLQRLGPRFELASVAVPVEAMVWGVAASVFAALLGSLAPAVRASRIPMSSVMRSRS